MRILIALSTIGLAAFGYACGSDLACGEGTVKRGGKCVPTSAVDECGPGTVLQDGSCVPAEGFGACAEGTILQDGQCVPAEGFGACSEGTELLEGQCVPVPPPAELAAFDVSVAPSGCDVVVSDLVPVTVTISALAQDGEVLTSFDGQVKVIGLGGVVVSPGTVGGFANGTASVQLSVSGVTESAQIVVFEASEMQIAGRSERFGVEAEQLSVAIQGPAGPVREGTALAGVEVTLSSNACRDISDRETLVTLGVRGGDGAHVVPSAVPVLGAGPHTPQLTVLGLQARQDVQIEAALANGSRSSFVVDVVPRLGFAGIGDAYTLPNDAALARWTEAQGGTGAGDYTYHVFASDTLGTLGSEVASVSELSVNVPLESSSAGEIVYLAVRVSDALDDAADQNIVQIGVLDGDIIYVDASNTASGDGSAANPYQTLSEAFAAIGADGATIYVGAQTGNETYADLPLLLGDRVHLVGGFTGWTDGTSTAQDWIRPGGLYSILTWAGEPAAPALSLGANSRLQGVSIPSSVSLVGVGGSFIHAEALGVSIIDTQLQGAGGKLVTATNSGMLISHSSLDGASALSPCVDVDGSQLELAAAQLVQCELRADTGSTVEAINSHLGDSESCLRAYASDVRIQDSEIDNCYYSLSTSGGMLLADRARFSQSYRCVRTSAMSEVSIEDSIFSGCDVAISGYADGLNAYDFVLRRSELRGSSGLGPRTRHGLVFRGALIDSGRFVIEDNLFANIEDHAVFSELGSAYPTDFAMSIVGNTIANTPMSSEPPGGGYGYAPMGVWLDASMAETKDANAQSVIVSNNTFVPGAPRAGGVAALLDARDLNVQVTDNRVEHAEIGIAVFGAGNESSRLSIINNTVSGRPMNSGYPGYPYPNSVAAYAVAEADEAEIELHHNHFDRIGSGYTPAAALEVNGSTSSTLSAIGNRITNAGRGMELAAIADDGQGTAVSVSIRDNLVQTDSTDAFGSAIESRIAGIAGTLDVVASGNDVSTASAGLSFEVIQDKGQEGVARGQTAVQVRNNHVVAQLDDTRRPGLGLEDAGIGLQLELQGTEASVDVSQNVIPASIGFGVFGSTHLDDAGGSFNIVSNDIGHSSACIIAEGYDVSQSESTASASIEIADNRCGVSDIGIVASARADEYAPYEIGGTSLAIANNILENMTMMALIAEVDDAPAESSIAVSGNTVFAASLGGEKLPARGAMNVAVRDATGTASVSVSHNRLLNSSAGIEVNAIGAPHAQIDVSNNLAVLRDGGPGIGISSDTMAAADGELPAASLAARHNTIVDGNLGIMPAMDAADTSSVAVENNIVQEIDDRPSIFVAEGETSPTITRQNNMVSDESPGDPDDFGGVADFVSASDAELVVTHLDPLGRSFVVMLGGPVLVGDRVRLPGEDFARLVNQVAGDLVVVDGPPLRPYGRAIGVLLWHAGNYLAPDPSYRLRDGSLGTGAATDGSDLGAYGGPAPLMWP